MKSWSEQLYNVIDFDDGGPVQHFLKSSAAVSMSVRRIARMTDEEAESAFRVLRWPDTGGEPVCPHCAHEKIYEIATRKLLKCAACRRFFSITSGTVFHSRKLAFRDILLAIALFSNGSNGVAALRLRREMGISYKAAFVLAHKLREVIEAGRSDLKLSGIVEIDGQYFGSAARRPNVGREGKVEVVWRRKQCVLSLVERGGSTVTLVVDSEETEAVRQAVLRHVLDRKTVIMADEAKCYNALHAQYVVHRINHRWKYAVWDPKAGLLVHTNTVESFNGRMRRAEKGVHHRISGRYLGRYAAEMALRSDRRQMPNGALMMEIAEMALQHPVSREWKGYWRSRKIG
jgi:transposase-like protein